MTAGTYPSGLRRWLIIATAMGGTTMQIVDMTIANVAIPHMQAALGATPDTIMWVLTSYIIMAAIATPVTGWLESRMGRRKLFALAMVGFTLSSAACGFAGTLEMMVIARAVQGSFAALLGPLALSTMLDSSPPEEQARTMTIFTMGITLGPIIGPVLGGWLTDHFNWRWVFFINLPLGVIVTAGILLLVDEVELPRRRFDLFGFALLAIGLAALQLMLDRGTREDWFESTEIVIEAGLAVSALWMFVVHTLTSSSPLVPIALFRDRNFVLGAFFTVLVMGMTMACQALLAPLLQTLLGYDVLTAGYMLTPRAVAALVALPIVSMLSRHIDPRVLVAVGVGLFAFSQWLMTGFTLEMDRDYYLLASIVQAVGTTVAFLPLNILAFSTLRPHLRTEAAAFSNLARNIASSVGIAVMTLLFARNIQISHSDLASSMNLTGWPVPTTIPTVQWRAGEAMMDAVNAEVTRQAMMVAYIDNFWLMEWAALALLPFLLLMRRAKVRKEDLPVMME